VLFELDQLRKRRGPAPAARLRQLQRHRDLVALRDDLGVEMALLLEQVRGAAASLASVLGRRFHPWEGGEGLALDAHTGARLRLGRDALRSGDAAAAVGHLEAALAPPESLGEARHPLDPEHEPWYELGRARQAAGDAAGARAAWERAASPLPAGAELHAAAAFRGLALDAIGRRDEGTRAIRDLLRASRHAARQPVGIDYFATSLPTFLVFEDDLGRRHRLDCRWLEGVALGALGRTAEARRVLGEVIAAEPSHMGAVRALDRIAR
jgi:tetratricopeptide (TPR) repeat protein